MGLHCSKYLPRNFRLSFHLPKLIEYGHITLSIVVNIYDENKTRIAPLETNQTFLSFREALQRRVLKGTAHLLWNVLHPTILFVWIIALHVERFDIQTHS